MLERQGGTRWGTHLSQTEEFAVLLASPLPVVVPLNAVMPLALV